MATKKKTTTATPTKPATKTKQNIMSVAIGELIGVGIGTLILTQLVPRFGFIRPGLYELWLPIGIYAMILTAMCRIVGKMFRPFYNIMKVLELVVSIYSTYYLVQIFPFDFARTGFPLIEPIVQIGLTVALWGMAIAILIHLVKFVVDITRVIEGKPLK